MPDTATATSPPPCHKDNATTIAIIGTGFRGTMLALHLLRRCSADTRIILIERNEHHGPGLAYATPHPCHLLNVPAGKMSAFPERPLDFLHWLQRTRPDDLGTAQPAPTTFVPRAVYGMYLRSLLRDAMRAEGPHQRLVLLQGNVIGLDHRTHTQRLRLEHGQSVAADLVVLANGNLPPRPIPLGDGSFYQTPFYHHDPRAPDALTDLHPDEPVLLIGTGLTMVDTAVALLDQHHRGPIHALSRRGKLPHKHTSVPPAPDRTAPYPARLTALLRLLRAAPIAQATGAASSMHCGRLPTTCGKRSHSMTSGGFSATCNPGGIFIATAWPTPSPTASRPHKRSASCKSTPVVCRPAWLRLEPSRRPSARAATPRPSRYRSLASSTAPAPE
ncbi:FAD/NAD(P)-binding protein [Rhodopila sp.]|uniref:FAD/NAD(P)-binding protein n=1 Tax=Rhodopila sp. TaxID=2480087 RepID=UPI003D0D9144